MTNAALISQWMRSTTHFILLNFHNKHFNSYHEYENLENVIITVTVWFPLGQTQLDHKKNWRLYYTFDPILGHFNWKTKHVVPLQELLRLTNKA